MGNGIKGRRKNKSGRDNGEINVPRFSRVKAANCGCF